MIQLLIDRFESALDVTEVHYPATGLICFATDDQAHVEGVSVQASALVALGNIGQTMGRLEVKFLVDFHVSYLAVGALFGGREALNN